jgi:hypothetical protein
MQKRRWTNEEDDVIEDGIAEGLTYREIAGKLDGRTETAVANRTHVMRTKYSRYNVRKNHTGEPPEVKAVLDDSRVEVIFWASCAAAVCSTLTLLICVVAMAS